MLDSNQTYVVACRLDSRRVWVIEVGELGADCRYAVAELRIGAVELALGLQLQRCIVDPMSGAAALEAFRPIKCRWFGFDVFSQDTENGNGGAIVTGLACPAKKPADTGLIQIFD